MAGAKAGTGAGATGWERARGLEFAVACPMECKHCIAAGGVRDGIDGLLFAVGQGRRGSQQRANGGGSGEDVKDAPSESATGRVNHAEYLNSVVGGVATRS